MQGNRPYRPRLSNTHTPLWSDTPYFGGFLEGLKIDGESDLGLDYFSGRTSTSLASLALSHEKMQSCIAYGLGEDDQRQTIESQLRVGSFSPVSGDYHLKLTQSNKILPQEVSNEIQVQQRAHPKYHITAHPNYGDSIKKTLRLKLQWGSGNHVTMANLPENGTLEVKVSPTPAYINQLNAQIQQKEQSQNALSTTEPLLGGN